MVVGFSFVCLFFCGCRCFAEYPDLLIKKRIGITLNNDASKNLSSPSQSRSDFLSTLLDGEELAMRFYRPSPTKDVNLRSYTGAEKGSAVINVHHRVVIPSNQNRSYVSLSCCTCCSCCKSGLSIRATCPPSVNQKLNCLYQLINLDT